MKHNFILFLLVLTASLYPETRNPIFIAIQPAITIEPFYEEGELDVNVLPIVVEVPIKHHNGIRFSPIINYHFGGEKQGISDISLFLVSPIFIAARETVTSQSSGFYIGPVLGFGRNILNEHFTTTLAIEPGYMFKAEKMFTICMGIQLGASHFNYDQSSNKWVSHWGPKVSFGFWL